MKGSEISRRYFAGFYVSFWCVSGPCIRASAFNTFIIGTSLLFGIILRGIFKKLAQERTSGGQL